VVFFVAQLSNFGILARPVNVHRRMISTAASGTLVHSTIRAHQIVRRVDQREMREGILCSTVPEVAGNRAIAIVGAPRDLADVRSNFA